MVLDQRKDFGDRRLVVSKGLRYLRPHRIQVDSLQPFLINEVLNAEGHLTDLEVVQQD